MMEGHIEVTYRVICDSDVFIELDIDKILSNEKVQGVIKREFGEGARGLVIDSSKLSGSITMEKEKTLHTLIIHKDDFADALTLAEEDAKKAKLLKNDCNMVELIDLVTVKEESNSKK